MVISRVILISIPGPVVFQPDKVFSPLLQVVLSFNILSAAYTIHCTLYIVVNLDIHFEINYNLIYNHSYLSRNHKFIQNMSQVTNYWKLK